MGILVFIEAMHLLPGRVCRNSGTLPAAVWFFSESLPHLLPQQAFSFLGPAASESKIELRFLPALFGVRIGHPERCPNVDVVIQLLRWLFFFWLERYPEDTHQ
jgi:hypothetical protein